jgi:hypothetical protein
MKAQRRKSRHGWESAPPDPGIIPGGIRDRAMRAVMSLVIVEHVYTRDFPAPLAAKDYDMQNGWRSIPVPPTEDPGWRIFDRSKDRKTGWQRLRVVRGGAA